MCRTKKCLVRWLTVGCEATGLTRKSIVLIWASTLLLIGKDDKILTRDKWKYGQLMPKTYCDRVGIHCLLCSKLNQTVTYNFVNHLLVAPLLFLWGKEYLLDIFYASPGWVLCWFSFSAPLVVNKSKKIQLTSAPEYLWVWETRWSRHTFWAMGMLRNWSEKISCRVRASGSGTKMIRSRRPGRIRAWEGKGETTKTTKKNIVSLVYLLTS